MVRNIYRTETVFVSEIQIGDFTSYFSVPISALASGASLSRLLTEWGRDLARINGRLIPRDSIRAAVKASLPELRRHVETYFQNDIDQ